MKKKLFTIILTWVSFFAVAGENLIINGDFEKGRSRWSGDIDIEFETPDKKNKICKVELDEDDDAVFYQKIVMRDPHELVIKFRIKKSDDYDGPGSYAVKILGNNGSSLSTTRGVPSDNEWNDVEIKYRNSYNEKRVKISFVIKSGKCGALYFDDFSTH